MTIKEIKESIQEQIKYIPKDDMDEVGWAYEEGIILSGNAATELLHRLEEGENAKRALELVLDYPDIKTYIGSDLYNLATATLK